MKADTIVAKAKTDLLALIKEMATAISKHNGNLSVLVEDEDLTPYRIYIKTEVYDTYTTEYFEESRLVTEIGEEEGEWYIVAYSELGGEDETFDLNEKMDIGNLVRIANGLEPTYNAIQ